MKKVLGVFAVGLILVVLSGCSLIQGKQYKLAELDQVATVPFNGSTDDAIRLVTDFYKSHGYRALSYDPTNGMLVSSLEYIDLPNHFGIEAASQEEVEAFKKDLKQREKDDEKMSTMLSVMAQEDTLPTSTSDYTTSHTEPIYSRMRIKAKIMPNGISFRIYETQEGTPLDTGRESLSTRKDLYDDLTAKFKSMLSDQ